MEPIRFLILGAGAIGGYVGGSLAAAGQAVTFVARPNVAAHWRANGLQLQVAGRGLARLVRAFDVVTTPVEALPAARHDCLILAVKSYATAEAIEQITAAGAEPPPILCLQNGVDNEAALADAFGAGRVIAGTVTTPVSKPDEGRILVERQRGLGLALEPLQPLAAQLLTAFAGAGLNARGYPAAGPMKWSKLFTNLVGNATSAILDLPVDDIFADRRLFAVEITALRECLAVMWAYRYAVVDLPGVPVRLLAWVVRRLPHSLSQPLLRRAVGAGRGKKMPSLHVDLHGGRRQTEVSWLHGAVARHGARLGVPAPVNQALAETVEALSAGRLSIDAFRRRPQALLDLIGLGP